MTSATAARIVFAAGLAALVLTGCKTLTGNLPTEAELAEMARKMPGETAIRERFEEVAAIYREICTAPEYAGYFEKTPCLPAMASRRQLNDRSKARAPEIEQMRRVAEEIEELNSTTRHLMTESGIDSYVRAAARADEEIDPLVRKNQDDLAGRHITWGEYNRRRIELMQMTQENTPQLVEGETVPTEAQQ